MLRDFFLGYIKIHILFHAAEQPVYGLAMIEELRRQGYDISPGTLYPAFHALEQDRLLVREDRLIDGHIRKYYQATAKGRDVLAETTARVRELVAEVIEAG